MADGCGPTSCASAAAEARRENGFKKATISRAEGGQLQAPVGRALEARLVSNGIVGLGASVYDRSERWSVLPMVQCRPAKSDGNTATRVLGAPGVGVHF